MADWRRLDCCRRLGSVPWCCLHGLELASWPLVPCFRVSGPWPVVETERVLAAWGLSSCGWAGTPCPPTVCTPSAYLVGLVVPAVLLACLRLAGVELDACAASPLLGELCRRVSSVGAPSSARCLYGVASAVLPCCQYLDMRDSEALLTIRWPHHHLHVLRRSMAVVRRLRLAEPASRLLGRGALVGHCVYL